MARLQRSDDLDALIARAQEGDARAFELLVSAHFGEIRRFARAFCAAASDADDLAQEAIIKVYKSIRQFRYQSAFTTWLFVVVRNCFVDSSRSRLASERSRERTLEPERSTVATEEPAADEKMIVEEDRERVWAALREVPTEFRTALVLFDIEGKTYDEVAAIEQVPVGTVKSRLSRGRAHLKALLGALRNREVAAGDAPPGTSAAPTSSKLNRSGS
jgi:RNA polymerase sigma-70 factor, ECF subfamily